MELESSDGNWTVGIEEIGLGLAFGGVSVKKTNVFRVYKRGKNKDSFVKKQYFFSNFCNENSEYLVSLQDTSVVSLTEQGFQALCPPP